MASQPRTSADPEVLDLTRGLITYIRELVRSRRRPVRDCERYDALIWAYEIPGAFRPLASGTDGVLLSIAHVPARPYPQPPAIIKEWLDDGALGLPERGDPELASPGLYQPSLDRQGIQRPMPLLYQGARPLTCFERIKTGCRYGVSGPMKNLLSVPIASCTAIFPKWPDELIRPMTCSRLSSR